MEIAEATGYGSGLWKRVDQSGSEIKVIWKAIIKQWKHRKEHKYDLKKKKRENQRVFMLKWRPQT